MFGRSRVGGFRFLELCCVDSLRTRGGRRTLQISQAPVHLASCGVDTWLPLGHGAVEFLGYQEDLAANQ